MTFFILLPFVLISCQKETPDDNFTQGYANLIQGENEKAIENFTEVINAEPNNVKAYMNRAYAYDNNGDYVLTNGAN